MGDIGKILAQNISELRRTRNWSQEHLAELCDLSLMAISQIETQRRWPTKDTISRLANALEVPEEMLFMSKDRPEPTIIEALRVIVKHFGFELVAPKKRKPKNGDK